MASKTRDRGFGALAVIGLHRPKLVLGLALLVLLIAGTLLPGIEVSTSRTGLVSPDEPQQAKLVAFYEQFGRPDTPTFVVAGGTVHERRATVDRLQAELERESDLKGRVLGRIDPVDIAKILFLQRPQALAQLAQTVPPEIDAAALVEGGLPAWLDTLHQQVESALDAGTTTSPEQASADLAMLGTGADALRAYLSGGNIVELFAGQVSVEREGFDNHGYVISENGTYYLVAINYPLTSDEGRELKPLVERLRRTRDRVLADGPQDVTADLGGLPGYVVDELGIVERGLAQTSTAATIGIFLLCLALFRSVRQTLVALLPLVPGLVLTLAAVRILFGELNLITSSFVAVLLGLGIDFAVHFVARRNEEVRAGADEHTAIVRAAVRSGPSIMTGAIVTSAAFLTTATTEFTAYSQLGIITAVGLLAIMVTTFVLIPPLLSIGGRGKAVAAPEPPGIDLLPGFIRRFQTPLIVLGATTAIAGAIALPHIEFNSRTLGFLPDSAESARMLRKLEFDGVTSPVFANITASSIEDARAKAEALRKLDSVAGVQTPSDMLPELSPEAMAGLRAGLSVTKRDPDFERLRQTPLRADSFKSQIQDIADLLDEVRLEMQRAKLPSEGALKAQKAFEALANQMSSLDKPGQERLAAIHSQVADLLEPAWSTAAAVAKRGHYLPADIPPLFAKRFVSKDGEKVALYAIPAGNFWAKDVGQAFAADVQKIDPSANGLGIDAVGHGQMILSGFQRASWIAAILIVAILLVDFRNLGDALLALLPTGIGWCWMLGIAYLIGLQFNVANIVVLPIVLGIGIAFGVHMMHRCREPSEKQETCGGKQVATLETIVRGTGGAVAVAALTTMVGFGGLTLADYKGMTSLGALMVIGIAASLAATVLILPAVLLLVGKAR